RAPRRRIAAQAMLVVVLTMVVTSPILSLWSTTLLAANANENQFISLLGAHVSGAVLADYVAVSGSLLLVFASNTGLIGAYHVFIALSSMGFLPRAIEHRNKLRGTPHWAIVLAIALPIVIVGLTAGNSVLLGDLYGFGLLGAFALTCISLDVVRWRDGSARKGIRGRVIFVVGVLTTVLVVTGWLVNLVAKPIATEFGGGLTLLGVVIGLITYNYLRSRQPVVFPTLRRPGRPLVPKAGTHLMGDCDVLAILPADPETAESVVTAAVTTAGSRPLVFLYRGHQPSETEAELLEVTDPYLRDRPAQVAFARAEAQARKSVPSRQYVYLPGDLRSDSVGEVWKDLSPAETLVVDGDQEMLPPVALDRVRRTYVDGFPVLHLLSGRRKAPAPAT
ncbi:MAG: APC family permease, partial [Candidatus Dormibacteraeota bacterium]|nr:APC family permease [Candidatus Dormibacteraeota bacterium]